MRYRYVHVRTTDDSFHFSTNKNTNVEPLKMCKKALSRTGLESVFSKSVGDLKPASFLLQIDLKVKENPVKHTAASLLMMMDLAHLFSGGAGIFKLVTF